MEHEITRIGIMRPDLSWTFYQFEDEPRTSAVLELKAPNILSWSDFLPYPSPYRYSEKARLNLVRRRSQEGILLDGNALPCIQQALKYARGYNIVDVALYDWMSLFVMDKAGIMENWRGNFGPLMIARRQSTVQIRISGMSPRSGG